MQARNFQDHRSISRSQVRFFILLINNLNFMILANWARKIWAPNVNNISSNNLSHCCPSTIKRNTISKPIQWSIKAPTLSIWFCLIQNEKVMASRTQKSCFQDAKMIWVCSSGNSHATSLCTWVLSESNWLQWKDRKEIKWELNLNS